MLFNSWIFLLGFLPVTLAGFFLLGRRSPFMAAAWLAGASLFFYGWWDLRYVPLLLASICFNYGCSTLLASGPARRRKALLIGAIGANLALLGYYKYAGFFVASLADLLAQPLPALHVILPVGISFFTFTQIAFLVDTYQGQGAGAALCPLPAVRHLFPAPDRRPGAASQGDDAAVRRPRHLSAIAGKHRRRRQHFLYRPGQESAACR